MQNMYMNPTQIFDIPSTQICSQKETHTEIHSCCPRTCNMESKKHFLHRVLFFCVSRNILIYKSLKHDLCVGISILPLRLIGVPFAECQMCIKKVEISQHLKDAGYKVIGMQLYLGFRNAVLFKLLIPLIFFFSWVFESIMHVYLIYDTWDATFIYMHRPRELYRRNYTNRIEDQLAIHVGQETEDVTTSAKPTDRITWFGLCTSLKSCSVNIVMTGKNKIFFPVKLNVTLDSIISETSSFQVHSNTLHRKLNSLSVYWVDNAVFECVRTPARWEIKKEAL